MPSEPALTATAILAFGVLVLASVSLERLSGRAGVPAMLVFLAVGVLAGSEGVGRIVFRDYRLAYQLGTIALVVILFDGGLSTPLGRLRDALAPALVLATVGVVGTAVLVFAAARLLGFPREESMLVGAIVSSTDAATVFSVLRGSGLQLRRRVGITLELESGINDPMAVILTFGVTEALLGRAPGPGAIAIGAIVQLVLGVVMGLAIGFGGRWLLRSLRPSVAGLYPVVTVGTAAIAFGATTLASGSGFLAVFVAALVVGNANVPFRSGILRVHDSLAWLGQITMFVLLGLLVSPSRLAFVAPSGLGLALLVAFVARPIVVIPCLLPFGYGWKELVYIGWVGLRGAVPIILATVPILFGVREAAHLFDVVFFVVVVSAIVPGATLRFVTRRLGLQADEPEAPQTVLEIASMEPLASDILGLYVAPAAIVCGAQIADIPFPQGAAAMLVVRGRELVAPRGDTVLEAGDHVYVFCRREDRALFGLLFGSAEP